jgi:adenylyltransferase/sulfurtransferase
MKLQQGSVVVVGAGGLGCPALQYLAAAGVGALQRRFLLADLTTNLLVFFLPGRIAIVDHDTVDLSNLSRQILYCDSMVGLKKATKAAEAIQASDDFAFYVAAVVLMRLFTSSLNPRVQVTAVTESLLPSNAITLLSPYDIILDCTDNAPTRYLLSDTAVFLGKPLVSGAAQKYEGQMCTYNLEGGPCYRCLFPIPPPVHSIASCQETGILGVVTGVIGTLQALEAIKILAGLRGQ